MADRYSQMQIAEYEHRASASQVSPGIVSVDLVVGTLQAHNEWPDHRDYLFRHSKLTETQELTALDFACGPGRNILLFNSRFKKIDGVDLSQKNLDNARVYTSGLPEDRIPTLYLCNGLDLNAIPNESYDMIFSTIAMQHICCHSIRFNYLKEFFRVLKPGGFLCVQMGFGIRYESGQAPIKYDADFFEASATNGHTDTRIEDPKEVENDLTRIGFQDFEYNIRPSGPGDIHHPNWIFWSARKE